MSTAQRWDEVVALLAAYGDALDGGQSDEFAALFVPEGELVVGERTTAGRDQLRSFAQAAPRGVHLAGLPLLEAGGARAPFTFVNAETGQLVAGQYRDTFTRSEHGRLLFQRREITIAVRVPPGP